MGAALEDERARLLERMQELPDEEGVALRLAEQRLGERLDLGRTRAQRIGEQLRRLGQPERQELERADRWRVPAQLVEHQLQRVDGAHLTLAVNVSAKQFHLPTFVEEVTTLVDYFGVNPARLKLEITESLMVENVDDIIAKMSELKTRGINFSMDDFGTGYSSLSYLKRLPLYQLKIDQSFVRDVLTDPNDAAIAKIIVSLAQSMNLVVIAEGVETEAQREFLEQNGCHAFQGYLFSKPVPVKEFEQLVPQYT